MAAVLDRWSAAATGAPGEGPPPVTRLRRRRWALVAALVALLVAVPVTVAAWPVRPALALTPAELRDRVAASAGVPWSGAAEATSALGLPNADPLSDVTSLLTSTTRMRAYYAAADRQRIDEIYPAGERDRYVTPTGQAVWDYGANLLTLVRRDPEVRLPRSDDLLPPQLARRLLSGTAPDDPVTALPARRVAGVDAAGFRVTVADPRTTVGALDVWADPVSGLPVATDVVTKSAPTASPPGALAAGPVVVSRFSELDQQTPDPALLTPSRPPGAGVTRSPTSDLFGVLGRGDPRSVPTVVDGVPRERPQRGFAALGKYGTSLSQLIVVPLPPELSGPLLSGVDRAGSRGRSITIDAPETQRGQQQSAQAGALTSPLLNLAVVRVGDRAWAVGGLVPNAVIDTAVQDIAGTAS